MLKYIDFCHFQKKYQKQLLNKELDASKKAIHKFGELLGNRNAVTVTKPNDINMEKQEAVGEIIIPPGKREEILNKLRKYYKNGTLWKI